jgi:hypothetical protein
MSYEGKPADYQVARIDHPTRAADATKDFESLLSNDWPKLNETLKSKGQPAIEPPLAKVAVIEPDEITGGGPLYGSGDPDLPASAVSLPANFRLLR